jgi:hypothetical protein
MVENLEWAKESRGQIENQMGDLTVSKARTELEEEALGEDVLPGPDGKYEC